MSLTDIKCRSAQPQAKPYKLFDGNGLYLKIMPNGSKHWRYRFTLHERDRTFAIGKYPLVALSEARERRNAAQKDVEAGKDPILLQAQQKQVEQFNAGQTFRDLGLEWHQRTKYKWSSKHAGLVLHRLEKYLFIKIGRYPISGINPRILLACLQTVEKTSPIVARRLLQYCSKILQYAQITDRLGTADFTPSLKLVLRAPKRGHFASIEIEEFPSFLNALYKTKQPRTKTNIGLKLMLLTFVRTRELLQAKWSEINIDDAVWIIPGERMKMKMQHIVPLSEQAIVLLKSLKDFSGNSEYLFPSISNPRKPMSNTALLMGLKRLGYGGKMTGHGFRSLAMGVGQEILGFPHHVIDRQLAHVPERERGAYDRAKFLPQRKSFMQAYSDHIDTVLINKPIRKSNDQKPVPISAVYQGGNDPKFNAIQYTGRITHSWGNQSF